MDFILNEAEVEDQYVLQFSDEEEEHELSAAVEDKMFIDDAPIEQVSRSFYRDLNNWEHYLHFRNQTRNLVEVMQEHTEDYFGTDDLPELYEPQERECVEFDSFENNRQKAKKFKDSVLCFPDVENHFFLCSCLWLDV